MSDQPKKPRQPIRKFAEKWGVSVRTVKRWGESGIIDPPEVINGRNYVPEDAEPRRDALLKTPETTE
jgi:DNA-binding transcriptional MerR regulator